MSKKKIFLDVYSNDTSDTSSSKTHVFSQTRLIFTALLFIASILGFVFFDFETLKNKLNDPQLDKLEHSNNLLEETIESGQESLENIQESLSTIKSTHSKVISLANLDTSNIASWKFLSQANLADLGELQKNFAELKKFFKKHELLFSFDPKYTSKLPLIHPIKKEEFISGKFGSKIDPFTGKVLPHYGIDYVANIGDTIIAPADGQVISRSKKSDFGQTITIAHNNELKTFYAHLFKTLVRDGAKVKRGQPIGLVGNSGRSSGPHLHYELRYKDIRINPMEFILE